MGFDCFWGSTVGSVGQERDRGKKEKILRFSPASTVFGFCSSLLQILNLKINKSLNESQTGNRKLLQ